MRDKNATIICALICGTLIICGVVFWPTLYRYDKFGKELPVRINRLTGYTEILYPSGWKMKVSDKDFQEIPTEEIAKIEIKGKFDGKGHYEIDVYNGSNWIVTKIKLSIEFYEKPGKKDWQRIYETDANINPFSTGPCSIKLMDYAPETDFYKQALYPERQRSKIRIEKVLGYKSK